MELLKVDFWIKSTKSNAIAFETEGDIIAINSSHITEIKFDKKDYAKKLQESTKEDKKDE